MNTPPSNIDPTPAPLHGANESTGIPQLDLVLGGGLPRGSLAIILGPPGSGKTTLATQIAFAAAKRGQRALILTALSEPTTKLLDHLRSYKFFAPELLGDLVQIFSIQQFLAQGTPTTTQEIFAAVRQTKANIVVLDGFQGIRGIEANFIETRQLLYDLGTRLSLRGTTTLLTTEADPRDPSLFPEMTTGDALIGLYFTLNGVRAFRSIEALKVRGRSPLLGRHSLKLTEDGVQIYPRLETRIPHIVRETTTLDVTQIQKQTRASFDLPELDNLLGGGLNRNTSTLLTGSLGTGKTLLALQFVLAGIRNNEPALYIGFRETVEQLVQKADDFELGQQFRAALTPNGGLTIQRWDAVELDPDRIATTLLDALDRTGARRVIIDSIIEIERAITESSGSSRVSNFLGALLATLRARNVTLLAIKETQRSLASQVDFSTDALAILSENVVLLQQLAYAGQLHRVLSVLKMRFSAHDYSLREFLILSPEGIRVLSPDETNQETLEGLAEKQDWQSRSGSLIQNLNSSERKI